MYKLIAFIILVSFPLVAAADESFEYMKSLGLYDNAGLSERTPLEEMDQIDRFMDRGRRRCGECDDDYYDDLDDDYDEYYED